MGIVARRSTRSVVLISSIFCGAVQTCVAYPRSGNGQLPGRCTLIML